MQKFTNNMKKILILNGPNLNLQGKRDVNIYGTTTFEEYTESLAKRYEGKVEFDYFQSNIEGELINAIHASVGKYDGVVLNAGGSCPRRRATRTRPAQVSRQCFSNTEAQRHGDALPWTLCLCVSVSKFLPPR